MAIVRIVYQNDIALKTLDNGLKDFDLITGSAYIQQKLKHRLLFQLGEWFADIRQGFPYRERVLVSNPDLVSIRSIFYQAIIETPGITAVNSLVLLFDKLNRTLGVQFTATMEGGEVLTIDPRINTDFILLLQPAAAP